MSVGDGQEGLGDGVALGVVGEELADFHTLAAVGSESTLQNGSRGWTAFVRKGFDVGVAAVVVDGDVEVVDAEGVAAVRPSSRLAEAWGEALAAAVGHTS